MRFVSTRGDAPPASLDQALHQGLAPDGGLYQPEPLPRLDPFRLEALAGLPWPESAVELARPFLVPAVPEEVVRPLVQEALDFPIPLVPLKDRIFVLELFLGPTLAFKDVGARFMARLLGHLRGGGSEPLTILTATSGDTGGAVAQAFRGIPGIEVVVLFPDGQVTPRQERQFSTLGRNVRAIAVQGDFDACQQLAKRAFLDHELRGRVRLTSANSINVGRFLPQSFYYFHAWGELQRRGVIPGWAGPFAPPVTKPSPAGRHRDTETPPAVLFAVPSGNFGNLAAGLMAKAMGLPGVSFLAATNINDEVPVYLRTGVFSPAPSRRTLSTAMDVGNPSNFHRMLHLYGGELEALRADIAGRSVTDAETRRTLRRIRDDTGYTLDPHSAVGMAALEEELAVRPGTVGILLATAHPAKFAEVVEPILGESLPIPPELARCLEGERTVIPMEPRDEALRDLLTAG